MLQTVLEQIFFFISKHADHALIFIRLRTKRKKQNLFCVLNFFLIYPKRRSGRQRAAAMISLSAPVISKLSR